MHQSSLPADVLDYIFSFLESDSVALEVCAQSHPFLSQFAERYLYSTVNLQDDGGSIGAAQVFEFNQLLLDTPRIGSCVRTVEVRIPYKSQFDVTDLTYISSILQKLSLVKKIALIQEGNREDFLWENLPETFRQAFLKCLVLPSMEGLSLAHVINFPLSALKDCKTIKTLQLRGWKHDPEFKVPRDTLVHPLPPIESLSIQSCEIKSFQKMLPWLQKRNIRSISFSPWRGFIGKYNFDVLPGLLSCSSNHLTTLDLDVKSSFQTHYNLTTGEVTHYDELLVPITLSPLLHPEELTIHGIVYFNYHAYSSDRHMRTSIPMVANLIKTSSSLKRVSLGLLCYIFYPSISPAIWAPLVRLITESSVSSFRLHITGTSEGLDAVELLTSLADCADLMEFVDKGVLVITPSVSKH